MVVLTSEHAGDEAAWISELVTDGPTFDLTAAAAADHVERCTQVIAGLSGDDSLLTVRLLTHRVVAAVQLSDDHAGASIEQVEQIEAVAQGLGDELAHAYALVARCLIQPTPERAADRAIAARAILDIAERHGDAALVPIGYHLLMVALLETGQIHELDLAIMERRHEKFGLPRPHRADPAGWFRCLRSILDGDTDLAEAQASELLVASDHEGSNTMVHFTTHMGIIGWMRGQIDGAEEGFLAARREHPKQLLWSASLAWLWLGQGRRTSAEALLRSLPPLAEVPRDRFWLSTMTVLAQIASEHGTRERAEELRQILTPFAAHLVPVGNGVAFWGTAARTLGLLEERLGMLESARTHLELAIELTSRVGAQAWLAEAQIELAQFGIRHGMQDIDAHALLSEAKRTCEARGFAGLAARAVHRPRIRVFGRFEVIDAEGEVATWTSRKARELLKMLVAARGVAMSREVLMDQLWPEQDPATLGNRFSVAINTIRRALDPSKTYSRQHHVVVDGDSVRLDLDHLDVDLERFFALIKPGDELSRLAAGELFASQVLPDEPYAEWAIELRDEVENAWRRAATAQSGGVSSS